MANIEKAVLAMPLLSRISRTADGVNLWQAVGNWWQAGEWRVRLGLVPVGHGIEIVRAVVSAAVLDGGANRIRRQGVRRLAPLRGHVWQAAAFTSGFTAD